MARRQPAFGVEGYADDTEMEEEERSRVETIDAALDLTYQLKTNGAVAMILDQARDDARDAVRRLVDCDPENPRAIRELQWRITRFDDLSRYVQMIVEHGDAARADLTAEQAAKLERLLGRGDQPKD